MEDSWPGILMLAVIGALLWWYFSAGEEVWSGYFYPNRHDLTEHIELGDFDTIDECRDAVLIKSRDLGLSTSAYDYECGLNCKPSDYGLNICEKTER